MMNKDIPQINLPIAGIEEGVAILKDGSLAVVLKALPINFDLKNELEQNSIIAKYQGFLNSLDFPIQIIIKSLRLDLEPYLIGMERHTKQIDNELLQIHAQDYINFMRSLVSVANIMSKHYFIVLTYRSASIKGASGGMLSLFKKQAAPSLSRSSFNRYRDELNTQANAVAGGLSQLGVRIEALNTQQLIELFYGIYNPDISDTERLVDLEKIQTEVVSKEQIITKDTSQKEASPQEQLIVGDQPNEAQHLDASSDEIKLDTTSDSVMSQIEVADVPQEAQKFAEKPTAPAEPEPPVQPTEPTAPTEPAAPDSNPNPNQPNQPQ